MQNLRLGPRRARRNDGARAAGIVANPLHRTCPGARTARGMTDAR
jgi:hypothetical protein